MTQTFEKALLKLVQYNLVGATNMMERILKTKCYPIGRFINRPTPPYVDSLQYLEHTVHCIADSRYSIHCNVCPRYLSYMA